MEEGAGAGSREQSYIELVKIYSCLGGLGIGDRHARWSLWKICSCWGICWLLVSRGARHVSYMELVKDLIVMREARHVPWNLSKICLCWGRQGMFHGNCERPACVEGGKACYMEIVKTCLCWGRQGMLHRVCERSACVEGAKACYIELVKDLLLLRDLLVLREAREACLAAAPLATLYRWCWSKAWGRMGLGSELLRKTGERILPPPPQLNKKKKGRKF